MPTKEAATAATEPARGLGRRRTALTLAGATVALVVLGTTTPDFFQTGNLLNLGQIAAVLGIVTIGQMLVMVGGGLDLSVGATAGLAFFAVARISGGQDDRLPWALAVTLGLAVAVGLVNSVLVVLRHVPPFVATLGTLIVINGVVSAWSQGVFEGTVPEGLRIVSTTRLGPISIMVVIWLAIALAAAVGLKRSLFGRRLYATGLNEQAAAYAGIHVGRVRTGTYVLSALLAAIAGLLLGAYTGFVDPTAGRSLHLESIAAAVVGGVSLFGGRGGAIHAFGGAALMTIVLNIGLLHGLSGQSQAIMTGVVLLAAAYLYGVRGRRER